MRLRVYTPSRGFVSPHTALSMASLSAACAMAEIPMQWIIQPGSFVHVMRDKAARDFLASPDSDLLFLDDDIGFPAASILRMAKHDVPVVGAVCPKRSGDGDAVLGDAFAVIQPGLYSVSYIGCGLLRLRRDAVESMANAYPHIFDAPRVGHQVRGEDVDFCRRYRELGGTVWADPFVSVSHSGPHTWTNETWQQHATSLLEACG